MLHDDVQYLQKLALVFRHDADQFYGDLNWLTVGILHRQYNWLILIVQFMREKETGTIEQIAAKRKSFALFQFEYQRFAIFDQWLEVHAIMVDLPLKF